ncbi:HNH endonuclease [Flavobacterium sp. CYK-4]|uniref:HNH endonuclease n=1 Tax=Flavobacterium lotistagni TaxID=2709660 RepID=UPI001409CB21|nr:HNH endonuclease [Flavobacterium lotistagni]NHM07610.1 HNH endonuclease [Flavobacterium lotistagni]
MTDIKCIFCKQPSHTSKSVEHIIPESLGSKQKVLPKGVVCDSCNQYFALKVEKPILSHESFRNVRAYYQVPSKKGKMPSVLGSIAGTDIKVGLKLNKDNSINLQPENEKDREQFEKLYNKDVVDFPPLMFPISYDPPKKEMARLLAKMALEALVYEYKSVKEWVDVVVESSHYDLIREFARFDRTFREWPFHQRRVFPDETQMVHPDTGEWVQVGFGHDVMVTPNRETYFVFLYYGIEYVINIGGPSIKGYEKWLDENNNISPMVERHGLKLVTRETQGKIMYFLEGEKVTSVFFNEVHKYMGKKEQ